MDLELKTRSVTSLMIGLVIIGATLWGTYSSGLLIIAITALTSWELFTMSAPASSAAYRLLKSLLFVLPIAAYVWHWYDMGAIDHGPPTLAVLFIPIMLLAAIVVFAAPVSDKGRELALFGFGLVYLAFSGTYALELTVFSPRVLLGVFILLWTNDVFAYILGKRFGRRKLAPSISPGKTWEGFVAGGTMTLVVSFLLGNFITVISPGNWVITGALVVVFGTLGDLIASAVKRSCSAKDSGKLLPGHGGIWDRFDSFYGCIAPVAIFISYISS